MRRETIDTLKKTLVWRKLAKINHHNKDFVGGKLSIRTITTTAV